MASNDPETYLLSFAQQRLWFLDRFSPGTAAYNNANTLRLRGSLDTEALARALSGIVARHDALRMVFPERNGEPQMVIQPVGEVPLSVEDLPDLAEPERTAKAEARAEVLARIPFVLAEGPLLRFTLLRLGREDHLLVYVIHHIISDRWSLGVWLRELVCFYNGEERQLAPLTVSYAEHARNQRAYLSGETLDKKLAWWVERLGKRPPVLELPTDRARPAIQGFEGHKYTVRLDEALSAECHALAKKCRASLFMTLMAAYQILLSRYTHQRDLVVGTFVAGRHSKEVEPLIGLFVNTLAVRTDLTDDPAFTEVVKRIRKLMFGSLKQQDLPFEKLVDELDPSRDMSRSPLVQAAFNFHNVPMPDDMPRGLEMELGEVDMGVSRLDLTLTMREHGKQLDLCFEYNTGLFEAVRIEAMMGHLVTLLRGVTQDSALSVSRLPLLDAEEHARLVSYFNQTERALPQAPSLWHLFETQVAADPSRIAVACGGEELSYGELAASAEEWSGRLAGLGVGPGRRVGIYLERSCHMHIAALAVFRSGAAYVPLDPAYPEDRLRVILADGRVRVLLTSRVLAEGVPEIAEPVRVVAMDAPFAGKVVARPPQARADDLAYLIFTSGSTGRPKGVMVPHGAAVNFLASMARAPGLTREDVLVAVTTLSFDISVLELYLPLSLGARVVIATQEQLIDAHLLSGLFESCGATVVQATPATWKLLLEAGWDRAGGLRILCGGEAMPRELAERLLAQGAELFNMYGPTETTVWSAVLAVDRGQGPVPVGPPIDNTQIHITDPTGQLVPMGVPGELCIAGTGVTRGYFARPALTAERYIPDAFSQKAGARLYRTGDLCKRLDEGCLEFQGRLDHQVKVRGFRIELGEIETALAGFEGVAECVAAADGQRGEQRLLAYLVVEDGHEVDPDALRHYLSTRLPEYMVPGLFLTLDAFPLTPNGKIDRKALPAPEATRDVRKGPVRPPKNDFELRMIRIWERLLNRSPIGVDDSFFHLGGHSLLAVRLFSEIESEFGKTWTLPTLFQHRTVAGLAHLLQEGTPPSRSALIPLRDRGDKPPLFCIRGLFLYQALTQHLGEDQPVYGIYLESEIQALKGGEGGIDSVPEMARLYAEEILRVQPHGPYYLAGASFGGVLAMEIGRLLQQRGEKVGLVGLFDAVLPGAVRKQRVKWAAHHLTQLMTRGPRYFKERMEDRRRRRSRAPALTAAEENEDFEARLLANRGGVYRAAIAHYRPDPYDGDLVLFRAKDENQTAGYKVDPSLGWKDLARAKLAIEFVAGDHLALLSEPNVRELAARLKSHLEEAYANHS